MASLSAGTTPLDAPQGVRAQSAGDTGVLPLLGALARVAVRCGDPRVQRRSALLPWMTVTAPVKISPAGPSLDSLSESNTLPIFRPIISIR